MTNTRSGMTPVAIEEMINRRVAEALETREANRNIGLGNENDEGGNGNGNGNGNEGGNGNGNHNENDRDARPIVRECTYQDLMKCQSLNFKGTEGVVGLIRWFEKMETVFHISNCPKKYQVKELMKLMAEVYCPRTEIQKMESELWNLIMVPEEEDRVEKFIGGLPDDIQGNVIAAEPRRLQDAVRMANNLMDQKLKGYAIKNVENKRKFDNNQKDNLGSNHHSKDRMLERGQVVNQRVLTCFECERQGHYRSDCPKLKDQNHGNKTGNKSGIDVSYAIELADGRVSETYIVLRGCTLGLLGHPFNFDLLPSKLVVLIPYGDEVLIVQGDRNVMKKETKDKLEEKRIEEVPTILFRKSFQKSCLDYHQRDKLSSKSIDGTQRLCAAFPFDKQYRFDHFQKVWKIHRTQHVLIIGTSQSRQHDKSEPLIANLQSLDQEDNLYEFL
ncbi:reverse transcriptase domain-containing protein [Tanacetum coccineum]